MEMQLCLGCFFLTFIPTSNFSEFSLISIIFLPQYKNDGIKSSFKSRPRPNRPGLAQQI